MDRMTVSNLAVVMILALMFVSVIETVSVSEYQWGEKRVQRVV
jgi:hypothetical protein